MFRLLFVLGLCLHTSWCYVVNQRPLFPEARLSQPDDWSSYYLTDPHNPGVYAYGYDIEDPQTGNIQFKQEERLANGTVIGSYGYTEPDGNVMTVRYVADIYGYRATVENSRDNPFPPKATPRPGPTSLNQLPDNRVFSPRPVAIVPNTIITPNVLAPSNLIPSSNLEVPIKNFDRNFVSQSQFNDLNNYNQFPTAPNYPGVYYVNHS